jgi:hypothetical protein
LLHRGFSRPVNNVLHIFAMGGHNFISLQLNNNADAWKWQNVEFALLLIPKNADPDVIPSEQGFNPHDVSHRGCSPRQ